MNNNLKIVGLEKDVALAPLTTFKIGGPAQFFYRAKDRASLGQAIKAAQKAEVPFFILGGGSNILVADKGFEGLVIKCELKNLTWQGPEVTAGAGLNINELIGQAQTKGLGGLEFLAGVPSTVGGAVWANAGSTKENIGQLVKLVRVLDEQGAEEELSAADCQFDYRDSLFKHKKLIITEVVLILKAEETTNLQTKIQDRIAQKKESQDLLNPSAGCIFKNPVGQRSAGQLIAELGLKGYKMGGAKVSEKHANFIVNTGSATAEDVVMLISYLKQQVRDNLGIQLQEEVEYVGF